MVGAVPISYFRKMVKVLRKQQAIEIRRDSDLFQTSFSNRPFPSNRKRLFQSEVYCEAIDMKMAFYCLVKKTPFQPSKILH